jgi:ABC-type antimicrobial peptide transport system permease subunit
MRIPKISIKETIQRLIATTYQMGSFVLLLMLYLTAKAITRLSNWRYFPQVIKTKLHTPLSTFYAKTTKVLGARRPGSIGRVDLIELSIRNMKVRKTRTIVTIGGMMIGFGAIVFLVSIGYGLQQLVITRVARLEEMKQADITPQAGGKVKITDKTLADFKDIVSVEMSLPLIAVVGRVNYQNSVSDMAAYGVTTDYLKQSAIKPVQGKIFDSNELVSEVPQTTSGVAGVSTEKAVLGEKIQNVDFTIDPSAWIRVRENPATTAKILGYTKRVEGRGNGVEVWGSSYESNNNAGRAGETEDGKTLGKWIKAPVLLWKEEKCDSQTQGDCEGGPPGGEAGKYMVLRDEDNKQVQKEGYFAEINLKLAGVNVKQPQVFGVTSEATGSAKPTADTSVDWVEIASEAGIIAPPETKTVELAGNAKRQAVVNRAMLKVLGINEADAVGKKFNVSFVVVGDLLDERGEKVESASTQYTIVGVTPEEKSPLFYVPFIDLRSLGITNYSQVKLVVKDQAELAKTRRQVEAMGYVTRSVADTVEQINSLFATLRTVLMLLGMVALSVAALGAFNTLTISLLERTREVGLMKAMGMKSSEVQELFLTESVIMGFFGGVLGIVVGVLLGKLAGLGLSFFAIFKGVGFVDISYVPITFVLVIIFLSLLVGIATGIYPAKRASKISALNALRYE